MVARAMRMDLSSLPSAARVQLSSRSMPDSPTSTVATPASATIMMCGHSVCGLSKQLRHTLRSHGSPGLSREPKPANLSARRGCKTSSARVFRHNQVHTSGRSHMYRPHGCDPHAQVLRMACTEATVVRTIGQATANVNGHLETCTTGCPCAMTSVSRKAKLAGSVTVRNTLRVTDALPKACGPWCELRTQSMPPDCGQHGTS